MGGGRGIETGAFSPHRKKGKKFFCICSAVICSGRLTVENDFFLSTGGDFSTFFCVVSKGCFAIQQQQWAAPEMKPKKKQEEEEEDAQEVIR